MKFVKDGKGKTLNFNIVGLESLKQLFFFMKEPSRNSDIVPQNVWKLQVTVAVTFWSMHQ